MMLKKYKSKIIISSIIILLPILFGVIMWDDLPDMMVTHFGSAGNADGAGSKAFAVFGLPCILLVLHFICLLFTLLDKKQKEQNQKALGMVFWIIPIISLLVNGIMYRAAFGKEIDLSLFVPILLGIMLIFMGNYLPKVKQNRTLGIKVSWTLNNEENWNKTHRLGGKVWVVGGLIMLFSAFLPINAMVWVTIFVITAIAVIPIAYSYYVYKQHQKDGIVYVTPPRSKSEKIAVRLSAVIVPIILIGVAILMFTGDIEVKFEDTSFKINASYYTDLEVDYSEIDSVSYCKGLDVGLRINGFNSAKLLLGNFQNEHFGLYTLYAYTGAKEYVVLTSKENALVIGLSDSEDTKELYDMISEKCR